MYSKLTSIIITVLVSQVLHGMNYSSDTLKKLKERKEAIYKAINQDIPTTLGDQKELIKNIADIIESVPENSSIDLKEQVNQFRKKHRIVLKIATAEENKSYGINNVTPDQIKAFLEQAVVVLNALQAELDKRINEIGQAPENPEQQGRLAQFKKLRQFTKYTLPCVAGLFLIGGCLQYWALSPDNISGMITNLLS